MADDEYAYDIGIIIDNRAQPGSARGQAAAQGDVDALFAMFDQQMLIEHIMLFERPEIEVVCDLFGCPETIEPRDPSPPLIWQITRAGQARLIVYYIGDGRIEGLERQLLFRRRPSSPPGDLVAISVDWLHGRLEAADPSFAMLLLDTGFLPRPPACDVDDPQAIEEDLLRLRRAFENVMRGHRNQTANFELSATTPVQAAHCDRFDLVLDALDQPMFTKFLLRGLVEGEADQEPFGDGDRLVALGELEAFLEDRISRAARFQWGRPQNVHAVGRRGKDLATLDGRDLSDVNQAVLARRARPDDGSQDDEVVGSRPADGSLVADEGDVLDDQEASAEGWTEEGRPAPTASSEQPAHCLDDKGFDLCASDLAASTEPIVTAAANEPATSPEPTASSRIEPADERGAACGLVAETTASLAATLVQAVGGDALAACDWALDRSEVERGPFARIFTPIGWRLGRSTAQDAVACLLDCNHAMMADDTDGAMVPGQPSAASGQGSADPGDRADLGEFSAFNLEICDRMTEPLPPYIGLPRWMPGTLMISEALRASLGCPPPAAEPRLPLPIAKTIEPPIQHVEIEDGLRTSEPYGTDVSPPAGTAETSPDTSETASDSGPDPRSDRDRTTAPLIETTDAAPLLETEAGDRPATSSAEGAFANLTGDTLSGRVRWLQMALTVDNRNPGPIDGAFGPRTMAAVQSWRRDRGNDPIQTGPLTDDEFKAIIEEFGDRFGQIFDRVPSF